MKISQYYKQLAYWKGQCMCNMYQNWPLNIGYYACWVSQLSRTRRNIQWNEFFFACHFFSPPHFLLHTLVVLQLNFLMCTTISKKMPHFLIDILFNNPQQLKLRKAPLNWLECHQHKAQFLFRCSLISPLHKIYHCHNIFLGSLTPTWPPIIGPRQVDTKKRNPSHKPGQGTARIIFLDAITKCDYRWTLSSL